MGTVDLESIVVEGGSCQEDRNRTMEKPKTISTSETEIDISSEISPATPKLEDVEVDEAKNVISPATPKLENVEDDEANNGMDLTLYKAATQRDVDSFFIALERVASEKRLTQSAVFNQVSPIGNTYLHIAASFDNEEIVRRIAHHFPTSITKKNFNGDTALHLAARAGHWNTIEVLLNVGKVIVDLPSVEEEDERQPQQQEQFLLRLKNEKGNTPMHEALMNSQYDTACRLINKDPEAAFYTNEKHESPLSLSSKVGSVVCVRLILSFHDELERMIEQVKDGKSPVHSAISSRNRDLLKLVLQKVPGVLNFTDEEGRFPLHYAASMGYLEEVGDLLEFSANAFQRDKNGLLPVHWAAAKGKSRVIKKLLLHCPHPGELLDQNGYSILHFVAKSGEYGAIRKLLKDPAFDEGIINMKDKQGNTPLHLAAMHFHPMAVNLLIWDSRVNLRLLNDQGMTALDAAVVVAEQRGDRFISKELTLASLRAAKVPRTHHEKSPIDDGQMGNTKHKIKSKQNTVNTLLLVATLVATVTFAAGFTVPGGYNNSDPDQGIATFLQKMKFHMFIICDTIAVYSSLTVVLFLILAQFGYQDALREALPLLAIAVIMMSLAFTAGVSVVVSKLKWLDDTIFVGGMFFIPLIWTRFSSLYFRIKFTDYFHLIAYCPFILLGFLIEIW